MDFSGADMAEAGGTGRYRSLDPALLPPLWLIYRAGGPPSKDSGAVHSTVRQRWLGGDADVRCDGGGQPSSLVLCSCLLQLSLQPAARHASLISSRPQPPPPKRCRQGMQQVAALAAAGRASLQARDWRRLAELMRENLRLRRQLYGDAVVGTDSLQMADAAASVGAAAKLTGSGGAVVALCPEGDAQAAALQQACRQRGLECVAVQVGPQLHAATDDL